MSTRPTEFDAFRIHNDDDGYHAGIEQITLDDLSDGDLTIECHWSSVNFKDALAGTGKGRILSRFPLVGGIDVAGVVVASESEQFQPGDSVLVTGCQLSQSRDGGYGRYLKLKSEDAVALPSGLTLRDAMSIGTAGFSAALGLYRMEANGQTPDMGPIVVTGASGGVGSMAIDLFTKAGYEVHAISGKVGEFDYLQSLGAKQCISRHDLHWGQKPLETSRWAGCVDNVGGDMLSGITRVIQPWGNIVSCGLAGGHSLNTTVMPFILRGVSLLGISSDNCPHDIRVTLWDRMANEWAPPHLKEICDNEVGLDGLTGVFEAMLAGKSRGRTVVRLFSESDSK